jgi:hypothetical protein
MDNDDNATREDNDEPAPRRHDDNAREDDAEDPGPPTNGNEGHPFPLVVAPLLVHPPSL